MYSYYEIYTTSNIWGQGNNVSHYSALGKKTKNDNWTVVAIGGLERKWSFSSPQTHTWVKFWIPWPSSNCSEPAEGSCVVILGRAEALLEWGLELIKPTPQLLLTPLINWKAAPCGLFFFSLVFLLFGETLFLNIQPLSFAYFGNRTLSFTFSSGGHFNFLFYFSIHLGWNFDFHIFHNNCCYVQRGWIELLCVWKALPCPVKPCVNIVFGQLTPDSATVFLVRPPTFDLYSVGPGARGVLALNTSVISEGFLWSDEFLMCQGALRRECPVFLSMIS